MFARITIALAIIAAFLSVAPSWATPESDVEKYSRQMLEHPEWNAVNYMLRGKAYYDLKQYDKALEDFDRAVRLSPPSKTIVAIYSLRGDVYHELHQEERAIRDYTSAIELNPNKFYFYEKRGIAYCSLKQFQNAIADFSAAIKVEPTARGFVLRARTFSGLGEDQNAIDDFSQAIHLDPSAEPYLLRADHFRKTKQYQLAIKDCTRAISIDPKFARAFAERGINLHLSGSPEGALGDLTHAISLDPKPIYYDLRDGIYKSLADTYSRNRSFQIGQAVDLR
jgi:FOG: TPR repeat